MARLKARLAVGLFGLVTVVMLASALPGVRIAPLALSHFGFVDLDVYRQAAQVVVAGRPLYAARFRMGFGFTYPPAAAMVMLWLAVVPLALDKVVVTLLNVAFVAVIVRGTLRLSRGPGSPRGGLAATSLLATLALCTEPVISAIGYGQVDLLIAALVLADLTRGARSRWGGIGIGGGAALKLTPLVFIPYLVLTGRARMAVRAAATFVASIAVSFLVMPRDAMAYWGGALLDTSRVTGRRPFAGRGPANQSLRGTLLRIAAGSPHLTLLWLAACGLVLGAGLLLAVRAARRGDEGQGFVLTALTGLLICPVSWTHHWVIAVPGVLLAVSAPGCALRRRLIVAAVALGSPAIWLVIERHPEGAHLGPIGLLLGDSYVLAGLATIFVAGLVELRRLSSRSRQAPGRLTHPGQPAHPGQRRSTWPTSGAGQRDLRDIPDPHSG